MRVLQVFNQYLQKGGEEASVNRIWENLGADVELERCVFHSADWVGENAPPVWVQAASTIFNPHSLSQLREVHEKFQPDCWLIHNVFPVGSASIYKLALDMGVPVVYYIHNFRPFSVNGYLWAGDHLVPHGLKKNYLPEILHRSWQGSRIKTAWLAMVLRGMHGLGWFGCIRSWVAISQFMKERFVEAGVPAEDIFVVPHFWIPQNDPPEPGAGEDYFLFLGRLVKQKGTETLLAAWEILAQELGEKTPRLVIAGQGPEEDRIRDAAARSRWIDFVGEVQGAEKERLLRNCCGVLAPSEWWEPLGLVSYEAFDYHKPLLAARSGGLTETVIAGQTGLIHTPGDVAGLAADVRELWNKPTLRAEMGRAGRLWLLENTGKSQWTQRLLRALNHAVENGKTDMLP